jgi:hypothetical protein
VRLQKSLVTEQQRQQLSTLDDFVINGGDTIIHSSHSTNTIPKPFEKLSILTPAPKDRRGALKLGVETRQTVDASTLSSQITIFGASKTTSASNSATKTGVSKDVVSRKPIDHSLILLLQVPEPSLAPIIVSTHLVKGDENVVSSENTSFTLILKSMDILSDKATLSSSKMIEAQRQPSPVASKEEIVSK